MAEEDACVEEILISIGLHQVRFQKCGRMRLLLRARLQLARRASSIECRGATRLAYRSQVFTSLRRSCHFTPPLHPDAFDSTTAHHAAKVLASATRMLSRAFNANGGVTSSACSGSSILSRTSPTR